MPPSAEKNYAFRQPFKAVAQLSQKTGTLTKPVDPYVEATIDYAYKGYEVVKTKVEKVPKVSPYLLVALGLLASATISFFLIIPAVIFFPITIGLGILTSFAAIVLAPVAVVFGWILISSPPVQSKVVKPALDNLLKNDKVAELLLAKTK